MTALNKSQLIEAVAEKAGITQAAARTALESVVEAISDATEAGKIVRIGGFGKFAMKTRPARLGRNPRTGETVEVDAKKVPYFKPGKEMRERLNLSEVTAE